MQKKNLESIKYVSLVRFIMLFNVPSVNFNYSFQSRSPLINGFVDQLLIETGPAGTHSVFEILQNHDRNSVHILPQSTPDSIIDGIYVQTVQRPDRRLDEVG